MPLRERDALLVAAGYAPMYRERPLDDPALSAARQASRATNPTPVVQATAHLKGPSRLLDVALRSGPYGDKFGREPDGLNLANVKEAVGGIDLGELKPRVPEILRTPSGKVELAPAMLLADLQRPAQDLARTTCSTRTGATRCRATPC